MLAIRMQRTGRKGHANFRVVVQDSRQTPSSGKFVALLGSYNPHAKTTILQKDKAEHYLKNGAQPSDRVIGLFRQEGITLPKWVNPGTAKEGKIRNPEKLRRNRPAEIVKTPEEVKDEPEVEAEATPKVAPAPSEEITAPAVAEASATQTVEAPVAEAVKEKPKA